LKQWEQDVADYGDNAYLMWECNESGNGWFTVNKDGPYWYPNNNYRRKESAAQSFDLERAKDGDVVEIFVGSEWKTSTIASSAYDYIPINEYHLLRMKFPPKVNHE